MIRIFTECLDLIQKNGPSTNSLILITNLISIKSLRVKDLFTQRLIDHAILTSPKTIEILEKQLHLLKVFFLKSPPHVRAQFLTCNQEIIQLSFYALGSENPSYIRKLALYNINFILETDRFLEEKSDMSQIKDFIFESNLIEKLEDAQTDKDDTVYVLAVELIENYFSEDN